jgi:hypothetical protein
VHSTHVFRLRELAGHEDYERIRTNMHTLFNDLAIETPLAA